MFITFEGIDGSGKTTQVDRLAKWLIGQGHDVLVTREPGGTQIGHQLRGMLLSKQTKRMDPKTEFFLFCAARVEHIKQVIRPALAEGKIVLCDRFVDSTIAYQGYGHDLSLYRLHVISDYATDGLTPDLTILLDIEPLVALRRLNERKGKLDRLDAKTLSFYERVREGYLKMMCSDPPRWHSFNGGHFPHIVEEEIQLLVQYRFDKWKEKENE